MKLADLKPKWLNEHLMVFLCPCCKKEWLSIKDIPMRAQEQFDLFEQEFGPNWNLHVAPCKGSYSWAFDTKDFATMTVSPSVDASLSGKGHWHGHIVKGMIV